jgi:hypothetical protein
METFKRLLLSVGATTFVDYYEVFEANRFSASCEEIKEALRAKGSWTEGSVSTKASYGKRIFRMNMETDALKYIVCGAARVDGRVKEKAGGILRAKGIDAIDLLLEQLIKINAETSL